MAKRRTDNRLPIIAYRVPPAVRRRTARAAKTRGLSVSALARAALLAFLENMGV